MCVHSSRQLGVDLHLPGAHHGYCHHGHVPKDAYAPVRSFRIPDNIYLPARAKADRLGESLSEVVRDALEEYIEGENVTGSA